MAKKKTKAQKKYLHSRLVNNKVPQGYDEYAWKKLMPLASRPFGGIEGDACTLEYTECT